MEITKEHKQVAIIEIDVDRKYNTWHGLHFNKLGKLLFSNKIAQAIYSILGDKLKQSTVMSENLDEDKSTRDNNGDKNDDEGKV